MVQPATSVKNSDGTYTVRIQHTVGGTITEVDFKNPYFAETLATAYAAMLNGQAVVEAKVGQLASDAAPVLADAKTDIKKLLAEAEKEAQNLIAAAKLEAGELKTEAGALYNQTKSQAEGLLDTATKHLNEAKAEAVTILNEARTEASKLIKEAAAKVEPTPAPAAPAKSAVTEEDEA
jgi:F0F1-type ATP synthase membrane subunit b/b'